ncbi:MAG: GspH/FimT family pseudopilin [Porticoccaceae bacterium]
MDIAKGIRRHGAAGSLSAGFTIIELAVTLVVLAVLVAVAVPSFTRLLLDAHRATVLSELTAALNLARAEALGRGLPVAVCRSSDAASCGSGPWEEGWLVFVNDDNDSPAAVDGGEEILKVRQESQPAYALVPVVNYANFITYRADGSVNNLGRITYCDRRGVAEARALLVNRIGRVRLSRDTDDDGIDEDEAGSDLVCP